MVRKFMWGDKMFKKLCLVFLTGWLSSCQDSVAPDARILPPLDNVALNRAMDPGLIQEIKTSPEMAERRLLRAFNNVSVNGVVSVSDSQKMANQAEAEARAQTVQSLLAFDENGDGQIEVAEFDVLNIKNSAYIRFPGQYVFVRADLDANKILTMEEVLLYSRKYPQRRSNSRTDWIAGFDRDEDGEVTKAEFQASMNNLLEAHSKPLTNDPSSPPTQNDCTAQSPKNDDKVVFVSGYGGSGLSSVVVSVPDQESEIARLVIEDGDAPLYVVASSFSPMIWIIEGETDRISRFVTGPHMYHLRGQPKGQGAGVGVVGLPKEKIEFLKSGCLKYYSKPTDSVEGLAAKYDGLKIVGRKPDKMVGSYDILSMKVPSGVNGQRSRRKRSNVTDIYRFSNEGLVVVDPETVIAPKPVMSYEVYPQEAGLEQLIASGQMQAVGNSTFKIVKPIPYFPAGLTGAHGVKFILGEGVPMPGGSPGHSVVYDEESGKCLRGHRCEY